MATPEDRKEIMRQDLRAAQEERNSQVALNHTHSAPVTLNIYTVTNVSAMKSVNRVTMKTGAGGAFHGGVAVYGTEYSFGQCEEGTGIFKCAPAECEDHQFQESVSMGDTHMSEQQVEQLVVGLEAEWPGNSYDLLRRNCCTFSNAMCVQLDVGEIPPWVSRLAETGCRVVDKAASVEYAAMKKAAQVDKQLGISEKAQGLSDKVQDKLDQGADIAEAKLKEMDVKYGVQDTAQQGMEKAKDKATQGARKAKETVSAMSSKLKNK